MTEVCDLKREANRRLDALDRGIKLLEGGWPITALENMRDERRSMERISLEEDTQ